MNDQLQQALATILNNTINAVQAGVSFLSEQLPDVIRQLLLWHAVRSGVFFTLYLVLSIVCAVLGYKGIKKALSDDSSDGDTDFIIFLCGGISLVGSVIFMCLVFHTIEWLQIIVAPKLYLIEYAASLVKK